MKKILLISVLLLVSNSFAFESGVYACQGTMTGKFKITLKKNGQAIIMKRRGYWQDHGDAATIIEKDTILEEITDVPSLLNKGAYRFISEGTEMAACADKNSPFFKKFQ